MPTNNNFGNFNVSANKAYDNMVSTYTDKNNAAIKQSVLASTPTPIVYGIELLKGNGYNDFAKILANNANKQTPVPEVLNPSTYAGTTMTMPTITRSEPSTTQDTTPDTTPVVDTPKTGLPDTPTTSTSDYKDLLTSLYVQQQQRAKEQQALLEQQAQNAYNNNMAALSNAYDTRNNALLSNYNTALDTLLGSYNLSKMTLDKTAEESLRDAYVNRMMSQRNLGQQLAAQGLSGGASESAIANLINQYGSNRNAIQRDLGSNLANLDNVYNQNRNSALQAYNDALTQSNAERVNYQMQLTNDLAQNRTNSYADLFGSLTNLDNNYLSNMADILSNQQNYQYQLALAQAKADAEKTGTGVSNVGATSDTTGTTPTTNDWRVGWTKNAVGNSGMTTDAVLQFLFNTGATDAEVMQILNAAGVSNI